MPKDDDWEDTSEVELVSPQPTVPARRLQVLPSQQPQPRREQSASARAAFVAIRSLESKFDDHAEADQTALKSIDANLTTMKLEHTAAIAAVKIEAVKASTNVERLIAVVETNAAARLRIATEAEIAAIHDHGDRRAKRRELAVKVLQWVGGPLVGVGIAWLLSRC